MNKQLQALIKRAHHLKPVVIIGAQQLTTNVHKEIERALSDHELIKIRINTGERDELIQITSTLCEHHKAQLIKKIGHVVVIYRKNKD